jgi:hypothetical protein
MREHQARVASACPPRLFSVAGQCPTWVISMISRYRRLLPHQADRGRCVQSAVLAVLLSLDRKLWRNCALVAGMAGRVRCAC